MEKKQSFGLRKKDLAVIGALLLLAVSCWLAYRLSYRTPEKQNLAVIMVDGQEVTSPSARAKACPSAMPTSSVVWL